MIKNNLDIILKDLLSNPEETKTIAFKGVLQGLNLNKKFIQEIPNPSYNNNNNSIKLYQSNLEKNNIKTNKYNNTNNERKENINKNMNNKQFNSSKIKEIKYEELNNKKKLLFRLKNYLSSIKNDMKLNKYHLLYLIFLYMLHLDSFYLLKIMHLSNFLLFDNLIHYLLFYFEYYLFLF